MLGCKSSATPLEPFVEGAYDGCGGHPEIRRRKSAVTVVTACYCRGPTPTYLPTYLLRGELSHNTTRSRTQESKNIGSHTHGSVCMRLLTYVPMLALGLVVCSPLRRLLGLWQNQEA